MYLYTICSLKSWPIDKVSGEGGGGGYGDHAIRRLMLVVFLNHQWLRHLFNVVCFNLPNITQPQLCL